MSELSTATLEPTAESTDTDLTGRPAPIDLKLPELQVFDGHDGAADNPPVDDTGAGTAVGTDDQPTTAPTSNNIDQVQTNPPTMFEQPAIDPRSALESEIQEQQIEVAGLATLGALADYTAADKRLTDIARIGKGKAQQIEDATANYWAGHPGQQVGAIVDLAAKKLNVMGIQAEVGSSRDGAAKDAGAETPEETAAYTAGCDAMLAATEAAGEDGDPVMPTNPHKKGTRLNKMFDKGVQDILAN